MIWPQERKKTRERLTALGLSAMILVLCWALADRLQVSGQTHVLRVLTFENVAVARERDERPSSAPPRRAQVDMLRMPAASPPPLRRAAPALEGMVLRARPALVELSGRQAAHGARGGLPDARASAPRALVPVAPDLQEKARRASPIGTAPRPAPRRRAPSAFPAPEFAQKERPKSDVDLDEVMDWINLRRSALPPGIRGHMEHRPGDVTATATIAHEGEIFEIYLLARLPLKEMRVVLVRGQETYYLIDRSFEREGRSFRVGSARRSGGVITGIVSEERAASSAEAVQFYNVFLSWWDRERLKL